MNFLKVEIFQSNLKGFRKACSLKAPIFIYSLINIWNNDNWLCFALKFSLATKSGAHLCNRCVDNVIKCSMYVHRRSVTLSVLKHEEWGRQCIMRSALNQELASLLHCQDSRTNDNFINRVVSSLFNLLQERFSR